MHRIERSWHYALYEFTFRQSPASLDDDYVWRWAIPKQVGLCRYVWRLIFMTPFALATLLIKCIAAVIGIGIIFAVIGGACYGMWQLFLLAGNQTNIAAHGDWSALRNLLVMAGTMAVIVFAARVKARYRRRSKARSGGEQLPLDSYELVREFIRGQWRRACPVLTLPTRDA